MTPTPAATDGARALRRVGTDTGPKNVHSQAAERGERLPPWRLLRTAPRAIWALVVLHGLFLACWSILVPIYHAPDEPNHADAVVRLYDGLGWPPPASDVYMTPDGLSSWVASPYGRPSSPLTLNSSSIAQADAVPREARPAWKDLREHYPPPPSNPLQIQQMVQHPPLYYGIGAALLKVIPGADSMRWDAWVGLMRLMSVALGSILPLVFWAMATAFTGDRSGALVAAFLPFAIPQLSHISSVVNNDAAVISFASLALLGVVCVLRGDTSRGTAAVLGVTTGLAIFSKSLSLGLVPLIVVAYLLRARPGEEVDRPQVEPETDSASRPPRPVGRPGLWAGGIALVLAFVVGGWWYGFQLIRTGSIQPKVPDFPGGVQVGSDVEFFNSAWRLMIERFWGSIGWYEVNIQFRYAALATLLVTALALFAVLRARGARRRLHLLLLLWPTLAVYAVVLQNSFSFYQHYGRVLGLQGRYLFLGVGGVAVVVAAGVAAVPPRWRRWAPLVVAVAATLIQAGVIRQIVETFWVPPGGGLRQAWGALSANAVWSPWAIELTVGCTAVAAVVAVVGLMRPTRTTAT